MYEPKKLRQVITAVSDGANAAASAIHYLKFCRKGEDMKFQTAVLHAGNKELEKIRRNLAACIPASGAFEQKSAEGLARIFDNKAPGYCYTRVANPTTAAFEMRITKLEGGMASVACASGMAAITNAF